MLEKKEQLILLHILKKNKSGFKIQNIEKCRSRFDKIIINLIENGLIIKNYDNGNSIYRLTEFGELLAVCLSKLAIIPKEYQNHRIEIRWFFEQR